MQAGGMGVFYGDVGQVFWCFDCFTRLQGFVSIGG